MHGQPAGLPRRASFGKLRLTPAAFVTRCGLVIHRACVPVGCGCSVCRPAVVGAARAAGGRGGGSECGLGRWVVVGVWRRSRSRHCRKRSSRGWPHPNLPARSGLVFQDTGEQELTRSAGLGLDCLIDIAAVMPPTRPRPVYQGTVIDCDIHHDWPSQDVLLYLSAGWCQYATRSGGREPMPVIPSEIHPNPAAFSGTTLGRGSPVRPDRATSWCANSCLTPTGLERWAPWRPAARRN
jgi:hypothetical protein